MRKKLFFLLFSFGAHTLFLFLPQIFPTPEQNAQIIVFFETAERSLPANTGTRTPPEYAVVSKSAVPEVKPERRPAPAKPRPKSADPAPVPEQTESDTAERAEQNETFPEQKEENPLIIANESDLTDELSGAEHPGTETAALPAKAERDGKVDLPAVQTFIKDRIQGEVSFAGKGRKLVSTPEADKFRLSNNTTVRISFKIDMNGAPYDIEIPPIQKDVEYMLYNFVDKMRFSAVLYREPDSAEIKITLKVR